MTPCLPPVAPSEPCEIETEGGDDDELLEDEELVGAGVGAGGGEEDPDDEDDDVGEAVGVTDATAGVADEAVAA